MMEKTMITDNIFRYCFDGTDETKVGYNIFALVYEEKALIIDTAYISQAKEVKDDLEKNNIVVEKVIISHYHPDHAAGTSIFNNCEIIGSKYYKANINNCRRWEPEYTYLEPSILVKNEDIMEFGPFRLKFLYTPGHSNCSISTIINDKFIHVGDLIMYTNEGKPILPIVTMNGSFFEHISSLELIKGLDIDSILLAHGPSIRNKKQIQAEINDRVYYLKKVGKSRGNLKLEDCLKNPLENYECTEWHDTNVRYFKRSF